MLSIRTLATLVVLLVLRQIVDAAPPCDDETAKRDCRERCRRIKRSAGGRKEYAAIIDAGSSGSRIRVYQWESLREVDDKALPDFKEIFNQKKRPGVSDYENKEDALKAYLKELIDAAVEKIPKEARSKSDLYFMATAGMRLLLEDKANAMIQRIDEFLRNKANHPLRYRSPDNSRILSGEEEGVFAWISVNYLKNVFKERDVMAKKTYGILEMGGASTQIAFAPGGIILADKFPVTISGVIYDLYVHSYLYYGQNYVDLWVKKALHQNHTQSGAVPNPCMVKGDSLSTNITGSRVNFSGTGSYQECQEVLEDFVYRVHEEWKCHPKPCAIGTVYQPTIKRSMEFIAVGAFIHTFGRIKALPESGKFSFQKAEDKVAEFCSLTKDVVMKDYPVDDAAFASVPCLMGTYAPMLFHKGYNFQKDTNQISIPADIDGRTADWTLGAIIYEHERRPKECLCTISGRSPVLANKYTAAIMIALTYLGTCSFLYSR